MAIRERYVWRDGELVRIDIDTPLKERVHVITDEMPMTEHPVNGQHYDSKSAFRRATKAAGCAEVGSDWKGHDFEKARANKAQVLREESRAANIAILRELID